MTEIRDQRNLTTNVDVTSRVGFGYDALARVTSTRDWLQPNTQTEAFELKYFYLDAVDRRTSTEARFTQYASGGTSETGDQLDFRNTYVWDKLNRVDLVTQQSANDPLAATWSAKAVTTRTVDLNYFADSSLQTISRTQGAVGSATAALVTTFVTVPDGTKNEGRILSITQSGLTAGNVAYSYGYDDHGRIASFTSPAGSRIYAYDSFDQVTGATGGTQSAELYEYDKNGNRTNVPPASGGGLTVTGAYNRVTNDGTYTYLYDKEGNRTQRKLTATLEYETYAWDYRQRLVSVTKKNVSNVTQQTVTYEYDGLDRRIRRTVANGAGTVTDKQRFLYDSNVIDPSFDEVVIVLDELVTGQPYQKVDHRYMNGPDIDQVFADEAPGNSVLWYLSDHQNTVRDVSKYASTTAGSQATVRNHLEYDSFGNVTSVDDPTTGTANDGDQPGLEGTGNEYSPQRSYTGREPDAATGLIYYRARWYDAKLGRFISEDPIGFAAGDANLSRYGGNSTPNSVDPSGLDDFNYQAANNHRLTIMFSGAAGTPETLTSIPSGSTDTDSSRIYYWDLRYYKLDWYYDRGLDPGSAAAGIISGYKYAETIGDRFSAMGLSGEIDVKVTDVSLWKGRTIKVSAYRDENGTVRYSTPFLYNGLDGPVRAGEYVSNSYPGLLAMMRFSGSMAPGCELGAEMLAMPGAYGAYGPAKNLSRALLREAARRRAMAAAERAVERTAPKGPVNVVLGLDKHLDDFAVSQAGKKVLQLAKDPMNWKPDFYRLMSDPSQKVFFNLKGVDVWPGVTRASSGRGFGATDWELLQIYSNKDWWSRITWIDELGNVVPNPFK